MKYDKENKSIEYDEFAIKLGKINQLNKKIHRAEEQGNKNKIWWRKIKLEKLKDKLKEINF